MLAGVTGPASMEATRPVRSVRPATVLVVWCVTDSGLTRRATATRTRLAAGVTAPHTALF